MKKSILILMLLSIAANAQVKTGLKAGAALTKLGFEKNASGKFEPSYYAGIFVSYKFNRIEPEFDIVYTQAGDIGMSNLRKTYEEQNVNYKHDYDINMVVESLSLKFYINNGFSIKAGGYYGQILSVKQEISGYGTRNYDLTDYWYKSDAGVLLGISYNATKKFSVDARYMYGLSDMSGGTYAVQNRMLNFGASYSFL
ncbi:outer membrane beta-barrel protein [Flavobacterium sp.]|uniref:outer membrane beta-barrel protein n=1 Tax=Flavobacterium sp. TaxID=239 RepID=UPI0039E6E94F